MFPKIILIDNFNGCNLKCSFCDHVNMSRKILKMDWALYRKIIDEVAKENVGCRVWQIFFGEPCILKDMPERIKYSKDSGLKDVVLNSNGLALTQEKAEQYISAGLDFIYVGIDAFKEDSYNKIRVGGDFNTVKKNVLNWRRLKDNIFVQFVETDLNKNEKDDFVKYWTDNGVRVKIRPIVSWIGLVDVGKKEIKTQSETCYWHKNSLSILNNGNVALCACDIHGRFLQGDVTTDTIKSVWEKMQKKVSNVCKTCNDWEAASAKYF